MKKGEKWLQPWHMGINLRVLSENYPMNTNMTGFRWFSKSFASLCFEWELALALEGLIQLMFVALEYEQRNSGIFYH